MASMNQPGAMARFARSRIESPYMQWAKAHAGARYTLASSGVAAFPLADLASLSGLCLEDLELNGPAGYGYMPLQQALANKAGVSPDCVVAVAGTSMANHLAMAASFDPGDDILVEWSTYELLLTAAQYLGANIRRFKRRAEDGFALHPTEIERALTPRTRLVIISNLHNPSSALVGEGTLREVGQLAKSVGARVLVDEVYLETFYSKPWRSVIHLGEQFIVTSSVTKAYGLGGLRCGWVLAEPSLARAMWRLNDLYGVNAAHPAERLSVAALEHLTQIGARYEGLLEVNRPIVHAFLDSRKDLECVKQSWGTVLFPRVKKGSVEALCRLLREKYETTVVPGSFFELPDHFRIFLAPQTDVLREGLKRLGAALDEFDAAG